MLAAEDVGARCNTAVGERPPPAGRIGEGLAVQRDRAALLETLGDLLEYFPRTYVSETAELRIDQLTDGDWEKSLKALQKAGAVGEICGWAFDAEGRLVEGLTNDRVASGPMSASDFASAATNIAPLHPKLRPVMAAVSAAPVEARRVAV